jgi:hypothetical protein
MRKIRNHFIPVLCAIAALTGAVGLLLQSARSLDDTTVIGIVFLALVGVGGVVLIAGQEDPR